jgi:hypothetical protein
MMFFNCLSKYVHNKTDVIVLLLFIGIVLAIGCSSPAQPPQNEVIKHKLPSGVEINDSLGGYSYYWDTPIGKMRFVLSNAWSEASDILFDYSGLYMQIIVNQNNPDSIDYLMQYLTRADTSGYTITISPDSVIFKNPYMAAGANEVSRTPILRDTGYYYYHFSTPNGPASSIGITDSFINSNSTFEIRTPR